MIFWKYKLHHKCYKLYYATYSCYICNLMKESKAHIEINSSRFATAATITIIIDFTTDQRCVVIFVFFIFMSKNPNPTFTNIQHRHQILHHVISPLPHSPSSLPHWLIFGNTDDCHHYLKALASLRVQVTLMLDEFRISLGKGKQPRYNQAMHLQILLFPVVLGFIKN